MKIKLLAYLSFYSFAICLGQKDSMLLVDNYFKEAIEIGKTNKDEALSITQIGIDLANKIEYQDGVGDGYDLKATLLSTLGDFEAAYVNYTAALKIRKHLKNSCEIGNTYKSLAYLYYQKIEQAQALIYADSAVSILAKGCLQQQFLGRAYIQKGIILSDLLQFEEAISLFLTAKDILINVDYDGYIIANENLGILYFEAENYAAAKSILLTNYNFYLTDKDTSSLAQVANTLGATFFELGDYIQSAAYLKKGVEYSKKTKNNLFLLDALLNTGYLAIELGDTAKVETTKIEIEEVINETGGVDEKLALAEQSVAFYDMVGLFQQKAQFQDKVIQFKDSLNSLNREKLLAKELAKLDIAKELAKNQTQRFYIACLALGLLGLSFIIFFLNNQSKAQKRIHQAQILARTQKAEELMRKKVLENAFQVKQDIHKKLHDQVSNPLSTASLYMEAYVEDPSKVEDLEIANKIVDQAYDISRKIAHELLPYKIDWVDRIYLSLGGLERSKAVEATINFNKKNINDRTFNAEKGAKVAAIIGNLLVNVEKHAKANQVIVDIQKHKDQIVIRVEDDGIGFDTNQSTGIGLISIKNNIKALKGTFTLESIIGQGTKATVFIPVT